MREIDNVAIRETVERLCQEAVDFAESSPDPEVSDLYDHVFSERCPGDPHC